MEKIQVAARIKPDEEIIWAIQPPHIIYSMGKRGKNTFTFDHCFGPRCSNSELYNQNVKNIVLGSLQGINGTIFAYGQTGSGKTHTMIGNEQEQGVLVQSLRDIFSHIDNDLNKTFVLRCSYVEIYNEQIFDLLKPPLKLNEVLTISEDSKKEFFIKGVTEESISTLEETLSVLQKAERNRHYAQTTMNHHSSRSHAIFRLSVQSITNTFIRNYRREQSQMKLQPIQEELVSLSNGALITESILNFVDLAGSEKVSNHTTNLEDCVLVESIDGKVRERVKEGQYINKSLFFLTQVIQLKAEENTHIPYRNSSLTKILRSSLGGNSRTLIILCINPNSMQFDYSISTLRFGTNAKKITNSVSANVRNQDDDEAMKIIIAEYEKRIRDLEKARIDEKETVEFLQKEIENQSRTISLLQERLSMNNKKQFSVILPMFSTPSNLYELRQQEVFHVDCAGDIMIPKSQFKFVTEKNHDCKGKLALSGFKVIKERCKFLEDQIQQLLENYENVKIDLLNINNYMNFYKDKLSSMTEEYEKVLTNCKEMYRNALDMSNKLYPSFPELKQEAINELRQFYNGNLKMLEQEEWKRQFLKDLKQIETKQKKKSPEDIILSALYNESKQIECPIKKLGRKIFEQETRDVDQEKLKSYQNQKASQIDQTFYKNIDMETIKNKNIITIDHIEEDMKQFIQNETYEILEESRQDHSSQFESQVLNQKNYEQNFDYDVEEVESCSQEQIPPKQIFEEELVGYSKNCYSDRATLLKENKQKSPDVDQVKTRTLSKNQSTHTYSQKLKKQPQQQSLTYRQLSNGKYVKNEKKYKKEF